jgi:transcriptional regulator with XRE-family HTH domain
MTDFGTRLKLARKNKKMTQKDLAGLLGVEQSTISNYEKNFRFPVASALRDIADQLDVSLDYLLGRSEEESSSVYPEASEEVSGSFLKDRNHRPPAFFTQSDQDLKALKETFFEHLKQGDLHEATELILNHHDGEIKLLDYYEKVFWPTLEQTGALWASGEMSVAEEHMISSVIDKLMTRLESEKSESPKEAKPLTAVLMLPGAEEHEFPLKMTVEVFKHHGWKTFYLGRSIPVSSLEDFFKKMKVELLVLSVTLSRHLNSCEALIRAIKALDPEIRPKIMVGGSAVESEALALNQLGADFYLPSLQALDQGLDEIEKKLL